MGVLERPTADIVEVIDRLSRMSAEPPVGVPSDSLKHGPVGRTVTPWAGTGCPGCGCGWSWSRTRAPGRGCAGGVVVR